MAYHNESLSRFIEKPPTIWELPLPFIPLYRGARVERFTVLMALVLASEEDLDGVKKLCGFVHTLLGSLAFCMKPSVVIREKPVILFFGKNLRNRTGSLPGLIRRLPNNRRTAR